MPCYISSSRVGSRMSSLPGGFDSLTRGRNRARARAPAEALSSSYLHTCTHKGSLRASVGVTPSLASTRNPRGPRPRSSSHQARPLSHLRHSNINTAPWISPRPTTTTRMMTASSLPTQTISTDSSDHGTRPGQMT
jgi:hypothetical protein